MSSIKRALIAVALLASPALAYVKTYKVDGPDAATILTRLESATGLSFAAACSTCSVNGNLMTSPAEVRVEVYESVIGPRIVPVVVTDKLKGRIDVAVMP